MNQSSNYLPVAKPLVPESPPTAGTRPAATDSPAATPSSMPDNLPTGDDVDSARGTYMRRATGFLISLAFHVLLLIILSLWVGMLPAGDGPLLLVSSDPDRGLSLADAEDRGAAIAASIAATDPEQGMAGAESLDLAGPPIDRIVSLSTPRVAGVRPAVDAPGNLLLPMHAPHGGGFEGRSGERRGQLVASGGGTGDSEGAVAMGLAWLAAHQWPDGGWRFDLEEGPCHGQCGNSGQIGTTTGATGLALLPFLGAGHTHLQGEYRDVVQRGLYYLRGRMRRTEHGGDLQEGTMYAHGIATIALCEAYGMTQDAELRLPAQRAINFICYAQHSKGGWRYLPQTPGDTTVFGWQMMALKSATLSGIDVPSPVVSLAERYLDSVQTGDGSFYGYTAPGKRPTTTAVGLLIRMYTGWHHSDSRLARGVDYLAKLGPSNTDLYFDYYATQVMHHYGGKRWPRWNVKMRDHLVRMQQRTGHQRGSWYLPDKHSEVGGRLYTTAMAVMILEVYYRHMPLYLSDAVENDL